MQSNKLFLKWIGYDDAWHGWFSLDIEWWVIVLKIRTWHSNGGSPDKFFGCLWSCSIHHVLQESSWNKHSNTNENGREETSPVDRSQDSSWKTSMQGPVRVFIFYTETRIWGRKASKTFHIIQESSWQSSPTCTLLRAKTHCFSYSSRSFCTRKQVTSCLANRQHKTVL